MVPREVKTRSEQFLGKLLQKLSLDQKFDFYLLLLYPPLIFLQKKRHLQVFPIPSPPSMTAETQFLLHPQPVSLLLDVVSSKINSSSSW